MKISSFLKTRVGVLCAGLLLTGLVLYESILPPWAPYFILYAVLAVLLPVLLRTYRFGRFAETFRKHWKLIIAVFAAALIWDQGISTFLADKLLALAGKAGDPFYSVGAALVALSGKAGSKFGISPDAAIMIYAAVVVIWAPVGEELFYRGYMQEVFSRRGGRRAAVLISAGFFGIRHMTHFFFLQPDIPWIACLSWAVSAFVYGLLMSYLYIKTETLWPPVLVHAAINICGVVLSM
ncbi:MAG: CPBP family intramembrane metalloprotease [Spirochaetales bacterium]|nr:CPBP family intramembrane metalloprotease [Spirochaetales bacterium]